MNYLEQDIMHKELTISLKVFSEKNVITIKPIASRNIKMIKNM